MKNILKNWKLDLEKVGLSPEIIELYSKQITILLANKVPIILDFEHLCLLLGRKKQYLASVINSSESHYREFFIPKRKGGKRKIDAPYPALLECQLWIYKNILFNIPIHYSAQAFINRKSIITNANIHKEEDFLLKIDLKDFFPSIKINKVISIFKKLGYSHRIAFYLAQICCIEGCLPQGAPTSPVLSNIVGKSLDNRLIHLAKHFDLNYSRYADDLAFSGRYISIKLVDYIKEIVESEGYKINESKTLLLGPNKKKILTGISITSKELKVPNNYKREIRKDFHFVRKYGIYSHLSKRKIKNPLYIESLLGKITFWLTIEPENTFAINARDYLRNIILEYRIEIPESDI